MSENMCALLNCPAAGVLWESVSHDGQLFRVRLTTHEVLKLYSVHELFREGRRITSSSKNYLVRSWTRPSMISSPLIIVVVKVSDNRLIRLIFLRENVFNFLDKFRQLSAFSKTPRTGVWFSRPRENWRLISLGRLIPLFRERALERKWYL